MVRRLVGAALALLLMGQAPPHARVADLGWMSGRWETGGGGRWTEENWSAPRAGRMIGYSRSGVGESPGSFEFLRIEAGADGVPAYLGSPGGRPAVAFRLTRFAGMSATFDNPDHDFPQRIRYARNGDTLVATISAIDGSNAQSWTYRRQ